MERHSKAPSAGSSTHQGSRFARVALTVLAAALCALVVIVASAGASKGVITSFGSPGTGDGQFGSFPAEANLLAVNSTGNGSGAAAGDVYVLDATNQRVEQFDRDGGFIRTFGSLSEPRGIAVDQATGNVYVDDQADHEISAFGSDGTLQGTVGYGVGGGTEVQFCATGCSPGTEGSGAGQLSASLGGIAVDPSSGDLYVADPGNSRVSRFELTLDGGGEVEDAQFVNAFGWGVKDGGAEFQVCTTAGGCQAGSIGSEVGQFPFLQPSGLAVNSTGTVYTAESLGFFGEPRRVQSFTPAGPTYTPAEFAPGILSTTNNAEVPTNVQIGAGGDVFVVKKFAAGATPSCPNGSASDAESRILELNAAGTEVKDTLLACAGINSSSGLAIDPVSGRLYLASGSADQVFLLDEVVAPSATMNPVTDQGSTTATFSGQVNPNGTATSYQFEYSSDGGATWKPTLDTGVTVGSGTSPVDVEEEVAGLAPNTAYLARLVAEHPFGAGRTASAQVPFTTGAVAPVVSSADSVATEEDATLHGLVDPRGSNVTNCHFEWGTTTSYGSTAPCQALPGGGQGPQLVTAQLHGLQQHTTYFFRLSATSAAGGAQGPPRSVTTGPGLPENRAWEMVSPPDKNGGSVLPDTVRSAAAQQLAPGEPMAFTFPSKVGFASPNGTSIDTDYIAIRNAAAGKWETHPILPRQDPLTAITGTQDSHYWAELAPDLSRGVVRVLPTREPLTPEAASVTRVSNLFLRTDIRNPGPGTYKLVSACPFCVESDTSLPTRDFQRPTFAAASSDFSRVAFESESRLTADAAATESRKAYEWHDGQVSLVGRVPASGDRCDDEAGPACVPAPKSEVGNGPEQYRYDAMSPDGSRILFREPPPSGGGSGQLYIRFGGKATVQISASEKTVPGAPEAPNFWRATPDLSRIFFTTSEQLVDSDTDICADLYRYDVDPLGPDGLPDPSVSHLTRISVDHEPADGICSQSKGAVGISDDGETVYFIAGNQLVHGAPTEPLDNSLYRWHAGEMRWIGALAGGFQNAGKNLAPTPMLNGWGARTSPDGDSLLFTSTSGAHLTGYQHGTCGAEATPETACEELYLYSAVANGGHGELSCVSCNPGGKAEPFRPSMYSGASIVTARFTFAGGDLHVNHALSTDGRFVFFDSGERLVPDDENFERDVYRYDSETGQLSLISSGAEGAGDTFFIDASADGRDVFFATRAKLSGWDFDSAYDIYDARVDGGLPGPPALVPTCVGDACQPPPRQLNDPTPSSATIVGPGNVHEKHVKKKHHKKKRSHKKHRPAKSHKHAGAAARGGQK